MDTINNIHESPRHLFPDNYSKLRNMLISSAQSVSSGVSSITGISLKRSSFIKRLKKSKPISPCRYCRDGLHGYPTLFSNRSSVWRAENRSQRSYRIRRKPCRIHLRYHNPPYTYGTYQADTYARLVFHTVDDMFQLPKLIAYIAALSCRIFNDRRYALRLA